MKYNKKLGNMYTLRQLAEFAKTDTHAWTTLFRGGEMTKVRIRLWHGETLGLDTDLTNRRRPHGHPDRQTYVLGYKELNYYGRGSNWCWDVGSKRRLDVRRQIWVSL